MRGRINRALWPIHRFSWKRSYTDIQTHALKLTPQKERQRNITSLQQQTYNMTRLSERIRQARARETGQVGEAAPASPTRAPYSFWLETVEAQENQGEQAKKTTFIQQWIDSLDVPNDNSLRKQATRDVVSSLSSPRPPPAGSRRWTTGHIMSPSVVDLMGVGAFAASKSDL